MIRDALTSWLDDDWLDDGPLLSLPSAATVFKLGASAIVAAGISAAAGVHAAVGVVSQHSFHGPPTAATSQGWSEVRTSSADGGSSVTVYVKVNGDSEEAPMLQTNEFEPSVLNSMLKKIREIAQTYSIEGRPLNAKAVRVARLISHQLPVAIPPTVGVDGDGNIFLHFKNQRAEAYLTLEPKALHMFCRVTGQPNIYIDDEPFSGQRLPTKIKTELRELFSA